MYVNEEDEAGLKHCFRISILLITLIALGGITDACAQYYPSPKPIDPNKENQLLLSLKRSKPDRAKISLLLDLGNIYVNKPIRNKNNLDRAMQFGRAAADLGKRIGDSPGYNRALLLEGDVYTYQNDIKAAENLLTSLNDTSKIDLMLNLSFKYWQRDIPKKEDDWKRALFFAEKARQSSIRYHLPAKEILALKDIAMVHADQGLPSAEAELLDVLRRYKAIKYPYLHYTYYQLADLNWMRGNPDKALNYIIQTINTMKATGDTTFAADFYTLASNININNENYEQGLRFAEMAVNTYKQRPGRYNLADRSGFNLVVRALRKLKRYKEALAYTKKAIREYPPENAENEFSYYTILGNVYRDMKKFDEAERCFLRTAELSRAKGGVNFLDASLDLGQLYVESRRYAKAKPYLHFAWAAFGNQGPSGWKSHMNFMMYLADSATGNYRAAMRHLSDSRGIGEFTLRQKMDKELNKLEVEYKAKENESALKVKNQHIKVLNQNFKLQQATLSRFNTERNVTICAMVLLLSLIGLLYKHFHVRQRANLLITKRNDVITNKNELITTQNEMIAKKNRQTELLVTEKEWLLKEVHHRVKNNLHRVICLLESQAAYLKNDALRAIEKSQHRIYTMSLIHQKLYQSGDVQTIDMSTYVHELVDYLKESFEVADHVDFTVKVDRIDLDSALAIPVGLIINEALTNTIKYAFPAGRRGSVLVALFGRGDIVKLKIEDNGIGIGNNSHDEGRISLGMELIKGLTKEIHGEIKIRGHQGVSIVVTFKKTMLYYTDEMDADIVSSV